MIEVLRKIEGGVYSFWCLGCEERHHIDNTWEFNNDLVKPTFSPSYLTWIDANPNVNPEYDPTGKYRNGYRCHSFIRNGMIEYLSDCTHKLAGQTIKMIGIES